MDELNQKISDRKEELFQLERTLGVERDKLEKHVKALTNEEGALLASIEKATKALRDLSSRKDSINDQMAKDRVIFDNYKDAENTKLMTERYEFESFADNKTKKLDERTSKIEARENDIFYKDNEFKRIAVDMAQREADIAELIDKNTILSKAIVTGSENNAKAMAENNSTAMQLAARVKKQHEAELLLISESEASHSALETAKRTLTEAEERLSATVEREDALDMRDIELSKREDKVTKDIKTADNKLKLLRDREAMYSRRQK